MYKVFNPLKYVMPYAYDYVVENDRKNYSEYYSCTEEFIEENKLILGGELSIDLLYNKDINTNKYLSKVNLEYVIYSKSPFPHANQLADRFLKIKSVFPSDYISVNTIIPYKELIIRINDRPLIKLINIPKYKGVPLFDLITTKEVKGLFTDKKIKVLFDAHLIDIYHKLYNPNESENWIKLLEYERLLFDQLSIDISKYTKVHNVTTGGKDKNIEIFSDFDCVIVNNGSSGRLQILIHEKDLLDIKKQLNASSELLSTNILEDDILKKWVLTTHHGVIEVFNSLDYELIPYSMHGKFKMGNKFVQLRFKLIELWNLHIVLNIKKEGDFLIKRITSLINEIKTLRNGIEDISNFQLTNYSGIYINVADIRKQMLEKIGFKPQVYYPGRKEGGDENCNELQTYRIFGGAGLNHKYLLEQLNVFKMVQGTEPVDLLYVELGYLNTYDKSSYVKSYLKSILKDSSMISNKLNLYNNMKKEFPEICEKYMAKTYDTNINIPDIVDTYIIKPVGKTAHSGHDINIVDNITDAKRVVNELSKNPNYTSILMSEYIKPKLLDGKKFHVRVYIVCTTFNMYKIFPRGVVYTAKLPFKDSDYTNSDIHLSNYISTEKEIYLEELPYANELWPKIHIVLDAVGKLAKDVKQYEESTHGFEVFAADILVKENLDIILMEVNHKVGMRGLNDQFSKEYYSWLFKNIIINKLAEKINLSLRKFTLNDKQELSAITSNVEVMKNVGNGKIWTESEVVQFLAYQIEDKDPSYKYRAIWLGEKLIGVIGIHPISYESNPNLFLTIFIAEKYQSKGIGAKSFVLMDVGMVFADVKITNIASQKLLKKLNFQEIGKVTIHKEEYIRYKYIS
jgi:RimJ/RimL family protein N-acetyltransferase